MDNDKLVKRLEQLDERIDTLNGMLLSLIEIANNNAASLLSMLDTQNITLTSIDSLITRVGTLEKMVSPLQLKPDTNKN